MVVVRPAGGRSREARDMHVDQEWTQCYSRHYLRLRLECGWPHMQARGGAEVLAHLRVSLIKV